MAMKENIIDHVMNVDGEELTEALALIRTRAPDLESVRKLNCWACNIRDVSVVRRMPNLEVCSLTINKLTSLRDFAHCYQLQELYVRTNNIQQLSDIHYLKNLKKLRSLWLSENPCANGDNYRLTVLRTLPNLQKLDNIAVAGDEITRAQQEGYDLPVPKDFSFSALFEEGASCSEDFKNEKIDERVSGSSEKWARPRQKRQQKKREDYWREREGGVHDRSGGTKSGDESSGSSGKNGEDEGGCNIRSSSDSYDGEDLYKAKNDGAVSSSKKDDTGQCDEEVVDNPEVDNYVIIEEAKSFDSGIQAKWAVKMETFDNLAYFDKTGGKDTNDTDDAEIRKNIEENKHGMGNDKKTFEKDSGNGTEVMAKCNNTEHVFSANNGLCRPNGSFDGKCDTGDWTCDNNSLQTDNKFPDLITAASSNSINVLKITSATDSGTMATKNNISFVGGIDDIKNDFDDQLHSSVTKVTEHFDTPLLDKTKLEDTLDISGCSEDQTYSRGTRGPNKAADLAARLEMLKKSSTGVPSVQATETGATNIETETCFVEESQEPANWEDNGPDVLLGVRPVDGISDTGRLVSTERMINSNILQAVLCLVNELDKNSLDVLASAVKGRLDSM